MGIAELPSMKLDVGIELEASYFNIEVGCYEPLIEPWIMNVAILQKTPTTCMHIDMRSDSMLNFNMTYGMAVAMRKIQDRIDLDVNEWENEEELERTRTHTKE